MMTPLANCPRATLAAIEGVLTDIDETVSTEGRLTAEAYGALEALKKAGLLVVPVTGRPAGWCDHDRPLLAGRCRGRRERRLLDVARPQSRRQAPHPLRPDRRPSAPTAAAGWRRSAPTCCARCRARASPRTSPIALADLAVDFCEDVPPLSRPTSSASWRSSSAHGAHAKVSSIHVNGWFGDYDKLTTSKADDARAVRRRSRGASAEHYVFAGDSPNDSPMFGFFPNAVGVANVRDFAGRHRPPAALGDAARSGAGFVELARALLMRGEIVRRPRGRRSPPSSTSR